MPGYGYQMPMTSAAMQIPGTQMTGAGMQTSPVQMSSSMQMPTSNVMSTQVISSSGQSTMPPKAFQPVVAPPPTPALKQGHTKFVIILGMLCFIFILISLISLHWLEFRTIGFASSISGSYGLTKGYLSGYGEQSFDCSSASSSAATDCNNVVSAGQTALALGVIGLLFICVSVGACIHLIYARTTLSPPYTKHRMAVVTSLFLASLCLMIGVSSYTSKMPYKPSASTTTSSGLIYSWGYCVGLYSTTCVFTFIGAAVNALARDHFS